MMAKKKTAKRSIHNPAVPLSGKTILEYLGASGDSSSGVRVTAKTALTVSPVWQSIDVITSDVSRTPFLTYRSTASGGKERAEDHSVYRLLRRSTGEMTSNLWLARVLGHALLYGNGYSRVLWRGSRIRGLEWLHRDWVEPVWDNGILYYLVQYPKQRGGQTIRIPKSEIFHLVGLTLDDMGGLSLVDYARNTIGRQMAAEIYGDDFFKNNAVPSGFCEHPGEMSGPAQERFLQSVENRHGGAGKRWKLGILEEGMKYTALGINPVDAMLIDQLKLGVMDVARFFNLPPHKLGDSSRVNYNSLEQEEKSYFGSSLGKWLSRFEFEANDKLFLDSEIEDGYFAEFLQDAWNKADTATRFNAYAVAINWGIMSRNEVRLRENLNPYDGGDEYLTPLTHAQPDMVDNTSDGNVDDTQPAAEDTPSDEAMQADAAQSPRAIIMARDLLRPAIWDATRHAYNVVERRWKKYGNFLECVNRLRLEQQQQVSAKLRTSFEAIVSKDAARLQDAVACIFSAVEQHMLTASECQPDELATRVKATQEPLRIWAEHFATELVCPEMEMVSA